MKPAVNTSERSQPTRASIQAFLAPRDVVGVDAVAQRVDAGERLVHVRDHETAVVLGCVVEWAARDVAARSQRH